MQTLKSIAKDILSWFTKSTAFGHTWIKIALGLLVVITAPLWLLVFVQIIAFTYLFVGGAVVFVGMWLAISAIIKGE
jgi:hypothetical protein